ncbi:MAG: ABC transporter ATP-binding protein [Paracoccaceae bacterium]|nr:ABC transporter ATP-binding protein [Paracoccaceae bacterium]MDE2914675.1 ABC transporter ATP-binding protein [Paracoccaceae bacterium]
MNEARPTGGADGTPSAVLQLRSISKAYRKGQPAEVHVLKGVDLSVARGETIGLVAPSGAGKSTLLHIAGLLDSPDDGQVIINGRELVGAPDHQRTVVRCHEVGFVYQLHHLIQEMTALENVVLPQRAAGSRRGPAEAWARELLERTGLGDRKNHRPAELSGGEQQRVAFCRALANRPSLLLADEPTGNLDPATSDSVIAVLMELVREIGVSVVLATHDRTLSERLSRRIRLKAGRLVDGSNLS